MLFNLLLEYEPLLSAVRQEWLDHFLNVNFDEEKARCLVHYLLDELHPFSSHDEVKVKIVNSPIKVQKLLNNRLPISGSGRDSDRLFFPLYESAKDNLANGLVELIFTDHKKIILEQVHSFIDLFFSQWPELLRGVEDVSIVKDETIRRLLSTVVRDVSNHVYHSVKDMNHTQPFFPSWGIPIFSHIRDRILHVAVTDLNNLLGSRASSFLRIARSMGCGNSSDFEWVSLYDGLQRAGIIEVEGLSYYISLVKANVFFWTWTPEGCIVCRPPERLKVDDRNRLHSVDGCAVKFPDGYGQYWVHGVNFDKKTFKTFFGGKRFRPHAVLALPNAERRIALMQHFGLEAVFDHIKSKRCIDIDACYSAVTKKQVVCELYDCQLPDLQPVRLLKLEDHTTHKPVVISVPFIDNTRTCRGAIAWTFGMSEEEYKLDFES